MRSYTKLVFILVIILGFDKKSKAQTTQERFHDLFITAGYSTAFGAALGTAFLSFTPNPAGKLRFIAIGASAGFISGSIFGSYIVFSPMFADTASGVQGLAFNLPKTDQPSLAFGPVLKENHRVDGALGGFILPL